ncbi:hypothetical protein [Streptomyces sp. NPDC089919]|uniref:hypothetical protein n=1 Tax=Streptomyces sp. NPDC089919 TaxID=3155188 RepID=UPI003424C2A3
MALNQHRLPGSRLAGRRRAVPAAGRRAATDADELALPSTVARVAAGTRLLTASVFLWAFADKTFGWAWPLGRQPRGAAPSPGSPPAAGARPAGHRVEDGSHAAAALPTAPSNRSVQSASDTLCASPWSPLA